MGYDVWLVDQTGASIDDTSENYTSNTSEMLYKHFPGGEGIHCLNGVLCTKALELINQFWDSFNKEMLELWDVRTIGEYELCHKYDSLNGWGSTVGTMVFIIRIQQHCINFPDYTVRISA